MKTFTFEDWLELPHEMGLHEVIGGELIVSPSPYLYHQTVSRRLQFQLYEQIELRGRGEVYDAPAGVKLSRTDVVEPDVFVIKASRKHVLAVTHVAGAPDLVVEVISPGSRRRDRKDKFALYEKYGVPEYWLVDPVAHALDQWVLHDGRYVLHARCTERIAMAIMPDVVVDLLQVWGTEP